METYLNSVWGKQANVFFTVTKGQDKDVNYDLDKDDKIDSRGNGAEPLAIVNMAQDATKDFNIFFLGLTVKPFPDPNNPSVTITPKGFTSPDRDSIWIGPVYLGTRDYITAHELGHALGFPGRTSPSEAGYLMFEEDNPTSPCKIGKKEWDVVNP